jgi:hypothetical protein
MFETTSETNNEPCLLQFSTKKAFYVLIEN